VSVIVKTDIFNGLLPFELCVHGVTCKIHRIARRCLQPLTSHTHTLCHVTPASIRARSLSISCSTAALFSLKCRLALARRAPAPKQNDFAVWVRCNTGSVVDGRRGHEKSLDVPFARCAAAEAAAIRMSFTCHSSTHNRRRSMHFVIASKFTSIWLSRRTSCSVRATLRRCCFGNDVDDTGKPIAIGVMFVQLFTQ